MFRDFNKYEKIWLITFTSIIVMVTIYFSSKDTKWDSIGSIFMNWVASPVSALTGILTVVLCAKGNINNYLFGVINSILYGWIAWKTGYYGDWLLNWFYFVPTQFLILLCWKNNLRTDKVDIVIMRKLTGRQKLFVTVTGIAALIAFGFILYYVDHWFVTYMKRNATIYGTIEKAFGFALLGPMFDSSTEVLQIIAQILLIKRYAEQWPFWIATNVITIIMWVGVLIADPASIPWVLPTLVMWIAFLINSIYGAYVWYKKPV